MCSSLNYMCKNLKFPAVICCEAGSGTLRKGSSMASMNAPYWTLSFCAEGGGKVVFSDTGESFYSKKGQISIGPAYRRYVGTVISPGKGVYHWIHINTEPDLLAGLLLPHLVVPEVSLKIHRLWEQIIRLDKNNFSTVLMREICALHILKILTDTFKMSSCKPDVNRVRFEPALTLMRKNISRSISADELASSVHMSRAAFFRSFFPVFGTTPRRWMENLKMDWAKRRMLEGIEIKAIASELAYTDPFQFSKRFKAVTGVPPGEYRKKLHSNII